MADAVGVALKTFDAALKTFGAALKMRVAHIAGDTTAPGLGFSLPGLILAVKKCGRKPVL